MENLGIYDEEEVENCDYSDNDDVDQSPTENQAEDENGLPKTVETQDEVLAAEKPRQESKKKEKKS